MLSKSKAPIVYVTWKNNNNNKKSIGFNTVLHAVQTTRVQSTLTIAADSDNDNTSIKSQEHKLSIRTAG